MSTIMTRAILMPNNVVFTPHNFNLMATEFKKQYKEENGETFKGNVYLAMTVGIIQEKKIPDIEDCILLIRGGNNWCKVDTAEMIYNSFIKAYPDRGTIGCFCDMCRILNQDIPFAKQVGDMLEGLEKSIFDYLDAKNKLNDMKKQLQGALSGLNIKDIAEGKGSVKDILNNVTENVKTEDNVVDSDKTEDTVEETTEDTKVTE